MNLLPFDPFAPLRRSVAASIAQTFGETPLDFEDVAGDPGLFGPGSVVWRVHADFPSMVMGGISSLFLQTLHPGAMAGVADHSAYDKDPQGRLQRTGTFVAGTTFGSMPTVERLCRMVRNAHRRVVGTRPDGVPYAADDPELLTWVHVAEHAQFVNAYQLYGPKRLAIPEIDAYFASVAEVAVRLGATWVPRSVGEVAQYFVDVRPELVYGDQARDAVHWLLSNRRASAVEQLAYRQMVDGCLAVLPDWAATMLELRKPYPDLVRARLGAVALAELVRFALGPNQVVAAATRRAGALAAA